MKRTDNLQHLMGRNEEIGALLGNETAAEEEEDKSPVATAVAHTVPKRTVETVSSVDSSATFARPSPPAEVSSTTQTQVVTEKHSRKASQSTETSHRRGETHTPPVKRQRKAAIKGRESLIEMERKSPFTNGQVRMPALMMANYSDGEDSP